MQLLENGSISMFISAKKSEVWSGEKVAIINKCLYYVLFDENCIYNLDKKS